MKFANALTPPIVAGRLFILFSLLFSSRVQAAAYYVDAANGNDSSNGSQASPWKTLIKGAQTAMAGDTVVVLAGTYIDTGTVLGNGYYGFQPRNSGTADKPIVFISSPALAAVITTAKSCTPYDPLTWQTTSETAAAWYIKSRSYITIDGFAIRGRITIHATDHVILQNNDITCGSIQPGDRSLSYAVQVVAETGLNPSTLNTIQNNNIHDLTYSGNNLHNSGGIMLFSPTTYNLIQNNMADCSLDAMPGGAVYSAYGMKGGGTSFNTWRYNIARNCVAAFFGIGSTNNLIWSTNNTYYQNIAYNVSSFLSLDHATRYFTAYNNTAYNVLGFLNIGGFALACAGKEMNMYQTSYNNISVGAASGSGNAAYQPSGIVWSDYSIAGSTTCVQEPLSSTVLLSDYNDFNALKSWGDLNPEGSLGVKWLSLASFQAANPTLDQHSTILDPRFVDPAARDFHLQAGSPALGTGQGGVNMGAYITGTEHIGPTSAPLNITLPPSVPPSRPTGLMIKI